MLRAMTERLGEYGFPFTRNLPRQVQNYASELRDVRNRWAHNEAFTTAEAYRAIDSVELLLQAIGAAKTATEAARLKSQSSRCGVDAPAPDAQSRPADRRPHPPRAS